MSTVTLSPIRKGEIYARRSGTQCFPTDAPCDGLIFETHEWEEFFTKEEVLAVLAELDEEEGK